VEHWRARPCVKSRIKMDLGVGLRLRSLFAIGTASKRRGKQHDSERRHGLSHPVAFIVINSP
jgi:hypothetical protein